MREVETIAGFRLRRFSLGEFQKLIELNFFAKNKRIELLDGLVMEMNSITPPHADCVDHLLEIFHTLFGKKSRIRSQSPVTLERRVSQPQPDVTVAIRRPEGYADRHMNAQEILLLVEVADTSLHSDRTDKLDIYASEGIKEYWIFNLLDNQLEVYQEPYLSATGEGTYKIKRTYARDETISPQAFPECQIALNEILPRGS
jgi:Uma2 family endonuclease